ncbi:endoglucanase 6-like protein [Tanacetum coccineum]
MCFLADLEKGRALADYHHAHIRHPSETLSLKEHIESENMLANGFCKSLVQIYVYSKLFDSCKELHSHRIRNGRGAQNATFMYKKSVVVCTLLEEVKRTMVKIDLPMSFDIDVLEHDRIWEELAQSGELGHVMDAVKWDTDYLIKAHAQSHVLYGKEEMVIRTITERR